ncbi:MAG: tail fiber domain-containing protein [Nitrosomonadaceae bacterium]
MGSTTVQAPTPPDPYAVAEAQGAENLQAAIATAIINQTGTVSPYGTTSFDETGGRMVGGEWVPSFTQTVNLSDLGQQQFDTQQAITGGLSDLALQNIGNVFDAQSTPFSLEGLPAFATSAGGGGFSPSDILSELDLSGLSDVRRDFGAQQDELETALFDRAMARINPQFNQQRDQLMTTLTNRGLPVGSESFQSAYDPFQRRQDEAIANAALDAVMGGFGLQSDLFGQDLALRGQQFGEVLGTGQFGQTADIAENTMALQGQQLSNQMAMFNAGLQNQARQQSIQEQLLLRQQPLNELASLLGTGPGLGVPQFASTPQVGVNAPDLTGSVFSSANLAQQNAQMQQQAAGGFMSSLLGLTGSLGSAAILSDIRLKTDIKRIGKTAKGFNLYEYIIDGIKEIGVIAQEVMQTLPEAVVKIGDYYAVNYEKVR